ncbi:MAG: cupredoxin domain-containing protein [Dehalococcoidales bacterium]|jgi:plastocyanin|nr:cupredoxin domain-containing protein [Dehalococcoidales bacterium]
MKFANLLFAIFIVVLIAAFLSGCGTTTPIQTSSTTTSPPANTTSPSSTPEPTSITIELIAQNLAFNLKTITVRAGAAVTIDFKNQDPGIPHNLAVYEKLTGGQTRPVFVGEVINGIASITYHFTAPTSPGEYFFECDVHPQIMNGPFIITFP